MAAQPKRLVVMFSPNGVIRENWVPSGGETDFKLGRSLMPLEPHRSDIVVLDGVDNAVAQAGGPGDGHMRGMGCMLTGVSLLVGKTQGGSVRFKPGGLAGGISVDQQVVASLKPPTRFPSLELGVQCGSEGSAYAYSSYRGAGLPLPLDSRPSSVFNRLFFDLTVAHGDNGGVMQVQAQRKAVLNGVMGEYRRLAARLGSEDRRKLAAHVDIVDEIETRLMRPRPPVTARGCVRPAPPAALDPMANDNFPAVGKLQMDLLVMALACDLTRVATLQWSASGGTTTFTWLGIDRGHHALGHDPDTNLESMETLTRIDTWYAEQFAYLIGTMLDNTVILWCNELARGNRHLHLEMPYVLAGRAGGRLKTGRFLRYEGNASHNDLLVSLLNCMDVPATRFGDPAHCSGPLARLL
jgi:hypothetical protein